jgi:serine/threonine protein kinase
MIGTILRQRYKIIEQLGSAAFSETYLAEDLDIPVTPKPKCVVKRFQPKTVDPEIVRLFEQEAQMLYRLGGSHDQIAKILAYFQQEEAFYLIEELIEGESLRQKIIPDRPWNEADTIKLLQDILEVLAYVHHNKVIHGNIKPENIIERQEDGKLVLTDFGGVKELCSLEINSSGLTDLAVAASTSAYLPIEQALGKAQLNSDLYAVGAIAIELLTGIATQQLPKEEGGEIIWRDRVSVSNLLAEIVTKMVRHDFRQRYTDATEAFQALHSLSALPQSTANATSAPTLSRVTSPKLIVIGGKYGYIDSDGRVIIQPQFDFAWYFSDGLARVRIGDKWGYIDRTGKVIIQLKFDETFGFSEGLAPIKIEDKWGYIDATGQLVIAPQFDNAWNFYKSNGLALIKLDNKYGYIDKTGNIVIKPQFDDAWDFADGLAPVKIRGKYGYIDESGEFVIAPQFDDAWDFVDGLARVKIDTKYGYIDRTKQVIVQPQFDETGDFADGLARVKINDKWGYIDKTGKMVVEPKFNDAWDFAEGMASVEVDGKYGYIDKQGEYAISPQFDFAQHFADGMASVWVDGMLHYIDKKGSFIY